MALAPTSSGGGGSSNTGGSTLLYSGIVSGVDALILDTGAAGIAAGYLVLELWIVARVDQAVQLGTLRVRFNADSTAIYDQYAVSGDGNVAVSSINEIGIAGLSPTVVGASGDASRWGIIRMSIPAYDSTAFYKVAEWSEGNLPGTAAANYRTRLRGGAWRNTAAITRISVESSSGGQKLVVGSRMTIFGRS